MGRIRRSSLLPFRRSVKMMNTPPSIRPSDGAKAVLPLRVGRVREDGQRARKEAFDDGDGKAMLFAFCAVAPVPVEAIRLQSHSSGSGMQLYRQNHAGYEAVCSNRAISAIIAAASSSSEARID